MTEHEWRMIDSARRDGTVFIDVSLEPDRELPEESMKWRIAGRPEDNYLCNGGQPWWIDPEARHLMPEPTHWKSDKSGQNQDENAAKERQPTQLYLGKTAVLQRRLRPFRIKRRVTKDKGQEKSLKFRGSPMTDSPEIWSSGFSCQNGKILS